MSNLDLAIGCRVRDSRTARALSQALVAAEMCARGWKWSQATVWGIEKGERPLRLSEAVDLSRALNAPLLSFVGDTPDPAVDPRGSYRIGYTAALTDARAALARMEVPS